MVVLTRSQGSGLRILSLMGHILFISERLIEFIMHFSEHTHFLYINHKRKKPTDKVMGSLFMRDQ